MSLRRAVSAAYYSLFHLLIDAATKQFAGPGTSLAPVRHVLARGFDHRVMANASKGFAAGSLPSAVTSALPAPVVPADLRLVASAFVALQQWRHEADYDPAARLLRQHVIVRLQVADDAFAAWRRIRKDPMTILYLGLLGSFDSVRRR